MNKTSRLERGSRDLRLLPVALTLWASCLGTHLLFRTLMEPPSAATSEPSASSMAIPAVAMAVGVLAAIVPHAAARLTVRLGIGRLLVGVCVMAALLGAAATWAHESIAWHDPVAVQARAGPAQSTVEATITGMPQASPQREYDCQADATALALHTGNITMRSHAAIRIHASDGACATLRRGARQRLTGTLDTTAFGTVAIRFAVGERDRTVTLDEPSAPQRWRERVQHAFLDVTDGLSEQGRVLVPGLTMGLLGQDRPPAHAAANPIDDAYADRLETQFRNAGIMHLMAVSGGHFAIVAAMTRRLGARLLLPRQAVATLTLIVIWTLAALMAPAHSVTRALITGTLGAAAHAIGRRGQAMSTLTLTVIIMLLSDPSRAHSYGFALSCAAVLGIIPLAPRIARACSAVMPDRLAEAVGVTVAAQAATLPIQALMDPQLPLWSVPANLLVAPFVTCSTLTGLAALAVAWLSPQAAFPLAVVSSWGTQVMARVAGLLADGSTATLPWAEGVAGACVLAAAEACLAIVLTAAARTGRALRRRRCAGMCGEPFGRNPRNRLRIWWRDTLALVGEMEFVRPHEGDGPPRTRRKPCPAVCCSTSSTRSPRELSLCRSSKSESSGKAPSSRATCSRSMPSSTTSAT